MLHPLKLITVLSLAAWISGCQIWPLHSSTAPVNVEKQAWEHRPNGCTGETCPVVNIETLHFPQSAALDRLVERSLLELTRSEEGAPLHASLTSYEQDFLAHAQPGWESYLQAKVREQNGDILVIELSSYLFTGGAHGMPGRAFINYDLDQERALGLSDMLLPGQADAFWDAAREAHQRWLVEKDLAGDEEFLRFMPFQQTRHVALTRDALVLKYDAYAIAPYSFGHPELYIPYERLKGILAPEYLPK